MTVYFQGYAIDIHDLSLHWSFLSLRLQPTNSWSETLFAAKRTGNKIESCKLQHESCMSYIDFLSLGSL